MFASDLIVTLESALDFGPEERKPIVLVSHGRGASYSVCARVCVGLEAFQSVSRQAIW